MYIYIYNFKHKSQSICLTNVKCDLYLIIRLIKLVKQCKNTSFIYFKDQYQSSITFNRKKISKNYIDNFIVYGYNYCVVKWK